MGTDVKPLMTELKAGLQALYGERLKGVYLFGSHARGESDEESDVDVLVILDDYESYGAEVGRAGELGAQLSLQYGVSISKVFLREREWRHGDTPFLVNVRQEAIAS
jgi:predicted nucleotidyltransferase